MPNHPFRRLLVACACALLLGAGCGGEDETERYREELTEAKAEFDGVLQQAGRAGQSPEQFGRDVERLQAGIAKFKAKLAELDTPPEAENEEQALNEALEDFDNAVGATNAAVQADDKKAVAAQAARVQTTGVALDQALKTLVAAVD